MDWEDVKKKETLVLLKLPHIGSTNSDYKDARSVSLSCYTHILILRSLRTNRGIAVEVIQMPKSSTNDAWGIDKGEEL